MIQGLIVLNDPTYVPRRWQGTHLFYAVVLFGLFFVGIVTGVYSFVGQCCPESVGISGHIKADALKTNRRRWCLPYGYDFSVSFHAGELGIDGCLLTVDIQPRRFQTPLWWFRE